MEALVLITIVFLLIAQAIGLLAYYSKRNKYSKSAQNLATFLPAVAFAGLSLLGGMLLLLLKFWVEDGGWKVVVQQVLSGHPPLLLYALGYLVCGSIISIMLSIVIQLAILAFRPPKYQRSRRRRKTTAESET
ncbi:MAG: hypothetical protein JST84_24430 [Acidobacteria bacterium]|nr:hypothetical protein [Acidobacteriota bacterium]